MFYPVTNKLSIRKGDVVAARCTMKNFVDHDVSIGSTGEDEMCNFYMMYYVEGDKILEEQYCTTMGPPNWYFQNFKVSSLLLIRINNLLHYFLGQRWKNFKFERNSSECK